MERLVVGRVGAPYGVRGWVHISSFLQPPRTLLEVAVWSLRQEQAQWQAVDIAGRRAHGAGLVAKFTLSGDRGEAQMLRGAEIGIWPHEMPATEPGEYYWRDLLGARVETEDGIALGRVASLMETGAHDVLVVIGERERLIPFALDDVIERVDVERRFIKVRWHPDD
ncbi:MAG: 16S rRNA processing protein RimM [Gammaproteobacteria bacterium]|nr:16S rRNA processing protein RimM [Gammaproteobacteria bacterium]